MIGEIAKEIPMKNEWCRLKENHLLTAVGQCTTESRTEQLFSPNSLMNFIGSSLHQYTKCTYYESMLLMAY